MKSSKMMKKLRFDGDLFQKFNCFKICFVYSPTPKNDLNTTNNNNDINSNVDVSITTTTRDQTLITTRVQVYSEEMTRDVKLKK
ncbi:hypothetical protein KSS87_018158, partial [Heliosperma pusillum]